MKLQSVLNINQSSIGNIFGRLNTHTHTQIDANCKTENPNKRHLCGSILLHIRHRRAPIMFEFPIHSWFKYKNKSRKHLLSFSVKRKQSTQTKPIWINNHHQANQTRRNFRYRIDRVSAICHPLSTPPPPIPPQANKNNHRTSRIRKQSTTAALISVSLSSYSFRILSILQR